VKSASSNLPDQPVNGVTAGVDWAWEDHAVAVVDGGGREIGRRTIEHSAAGLRDLLGLLRRYRVAEVAIERPDGPLVETLLEAAITVVVISPNQVKNLRGRYGSAGNKDDRFDAFVLADTLRTDRARLVPLSRDSDATIALRRTCRARKDLVGHRVAAANQLREHLQNVFPRRRCAVRRSGFPDQLGLLGPLRLPRPRGLAVGETTRQLAGLGGLQRRGPSRGALCPAGVGPARRDRPPRRCSGPHHRSTAGRAHHFDRADQGPGGPDRPTA
jgi:transposase